jgi:hypothetical protein
VTTGCDIRSSLEQSFPKKLTSPHLVKKFPAYSEKYFSFLCSRQLIICPNFETHQSSPRPPILFIEVLFNIILPSPPTSAKWALSFRFPHQSPVCISLLPHKCHMPAHTVLLYFVTGITFG